jgi:hypothetical protein
VARAFDGNTGRRGGRKEGEEGAERRKKGGAQATLLLRIVTLCQDTRRSLCTNKNTLRRKCLTMSNHNNINPTQKVKEPKVKQNLPSLLPSSLWFSLGAF